MESIPSSLLHQSFQQMKNQSVRECVESWNKGCELRETIKKGIEEINQGWGRENEVEKERKKLRKEEEVEEEWNVDIQSRNLLSPCESLFITTV